MTPQTNKKPNVKPRFEHGLEMKTWLGNRDHQQADTRDKILVAAFQEIHRNGYQAANIQNIIDQAGISKGAFYHYFKSKHALVGVLLDEVLTKYVEQVFIHPMLITDDPITVLIQTLMSMKSEMSESDVTLGCPLDSLAQEMAPIDESVQLKIDELYQRKQDTFSAALRRGQTVGNVRQDIDPESVSLMVSATLQGCMGLAKSARSLAVLEQCGTGLIHYLEQLKVQHPVA